MRDGRRPPPPTAHIRGCEELAVADAQILAEALEQPGPVVDRGWRREAQPLRSRNGVHVHVASPRQEIRRRRQGSLGDDLGAVALLELLGQIRVGAVDQDLVGDEQLASWVSGPTAATARRFRRPCQSA